MNTAQEKLNALRQQIAAEGLDGFIIPLTDEHQSEYVSANAQRLAWLTGFTGSYGVAVVLADKAAVVSDGRYTIQIMSEVDGNLYDRLNVADQGHLDWLYDTMPEGAKIGFDAWLHTASWATQARQKLAKKGAELVAVSDNLVDRIWRDQPAEPTGKVDIHPDQYAGESAASKRARLAIDLKNDGADTAVLSALDSIAWAFNIRSTDVKHTPVSIAYAFLHADETADLFLHADKITAELKSSLGNAIRVREKNEFQDALKELGKQTKIVLIDKDTASETISKTLEDSGAKIIKGSDPAVLPKAIKNPTEQEGARQAHIRDGVAIVKTMHWLKTEGPKGHLSELDVVDQLLAFRQESDLLRDISFRTISGSGPNGAIVHYSVDEKSNRAVENNSVFLLDSGGQYPDGTTDITRTMAIGDAGEDARRYHTLVLKGHIALATAKFPKGTTGPQLDSIARFPLWQSGLDYDHGTGHGVGSFLAVHEGPGRISKGPNSIALEPGMIFSNEPGYYQTGRFGFRQENLELVVEVEIDGAERPMLGFECLTLAPIDQDLINLKMLSETEKLWLQHYHQRVFETLSPLLTGEALNWLKRVTQPTN